MANGTLKVSNIETSSGSGTITLGASGETVDLSNGTMTLNSSMKNTPAFFAYLGSNQDVSDDTWTKVNINTEEYDSNSMFDVSTYRFTPTTAGKYFFYATICLRSGSDNQLRSCGMAFYKNGSALYGGTNDVGSEQITSEQISIQSSFSMNGSSDYVELYGRIDVASSTPQFSANYQGANRNTYFGAYRIIGA